MDRSGPGGSQANADLAGKLGVRARHKCRHLFMANLDELELVADAIEGAGNAVDTIARVSVDTIEPPVDESLQQEITDSHGELLLNLRCEMGNNTYTLSRSIPFDARRRLGRPSPRATRLRLPRQVRRCQATIRQPLQ